jgi:hypothetical protein
MIMLCIKDNTPITCPAPGKSCKHTLTEDEVRQVAKINPSGGITPEAMKKFSEQTLLRGIQSIPGVIGCPTAGCPNWVVPHDTRAKERCVCQICRSNFCSLCKKIYHYHSSCTEVFMFAERWMQWCATGRARYNHGKAEAIAQINSQRAAIEKRNAELKSRFEALRADEQFKSANGRHCPKCNRVIIKDGGCDSMVCGRDYHGGNVQDGCGTGFAWSSARPYVPAASTDPKLETANVEIPEIARETVHVGVACDRCKQEIKGLRISCIHCPAMDLCERCETTATLSHPHEHVFRVFSTQADM